MPVISATMRRSRDWRKCAACTKIIAPRSQYVRAYGYAHQGDPKYAVSLHLECACTETRERLRATQASNGGKEGVDG